MHKRVGAYLGTEIDETWWKRYRKNGFFARGNGEYCFKDDGLYFRRYLTKKPIAIPYSGIEKIQLGKWHAGQWRMGKPILKIVWVKDGLRLSSGFVVSRSLEETRNLKAELENRVGPH
jgi:hypothetical protein